MLTPNRYASYTVPVRQYRILQSRFLHCCRHQQPACDLLMLRAQLVPLSNGNPAHKGFSPSGKKNHPRTIGIFNKICKFDIFTDLRWWVHCSCRAHTQATCIGGVEKLHFVCVPCGQFCFFDRKAHANPQMQLAPCVGSKPKKKRETGHNMADHQTSSM